MNINVNDSSFWTMETLLIFLIVVGAVVSLVYTLLIKKYPTETRRYIITSSFIQSIIGTAVFGMCTLMDSAGSILSGIYFSKSNLDKLQMFALIFAILTWLGAIIYSELKIKQIYATQSSDGIDEPKSISRDRVFLVAAVLCTISASVAVVTGILGIFNLVSIFFEYFFTILSISFFALTVTLILRLVLEQQMLFQSAVKFQ